MFAILKPERELLPRVTATCFFCDKQQTASTSAADRALPRLAAAIQNIEKLIKSMFSGKTALKMTPIE